MVLADGMGGHAAGDVASKIVVTEVFAELKLQCGNQAEFERNVSDILLDAALSANECVNGHVQNNPKTAGMGATLVAPVFIRDSMSWISIGDSPLFLYRDGRLVQLNEDHSMAPQIDLMVASGMIGEDAGASHPDRNCLTSVLIGDEIPRIDCPKSPIKILDGDILIVASDGLQFLTNRQIEKVLGNSKDQTSQEIVTRLLAGLEKLSDPDQDNISFSVVQVQVENRVCNVAQLPISPDRKSQIAFSSGRTSSGKVARKRHAVVRPYNLFREYLDASDGTK